MPGKPLFRIPISVSRNNYCKTNLRGVTQGVPYDFVVPSRGFSTGSALSSIDVSGSGVGDWYTMIRHTFSSNNPYDNPTIVYSSCVSTSDFASIIFRLKIYTHPTPPPYQMVLENGRLGLSGYGIYIIYNFGTYDIYFTRLNDSFPFTDPIQMNSGSLNENQWYQFSVKYNIGARSTTVTVYQDGNLTTNTSFAVNMTTPSIGTNVFGYFGEFTDFAILDTLLPNSQLAAFGKAPYV